MRLKTKNNTIISLIAVAILLVLCMIFVENTYFTILLFTFSFVFAMSLKDYGDHPFFLCFLLSFFIFLLGRPIALEIFNFTKPYAITFDNATRNITYIYLTVSIISLYIGFVFFSKVKHSNKEHIDKDNIMFNNTLLKFTKLLSILLYLFVIIENILRFIFIKDVGYTNSYTFEAAYTLPFGLHYLVEIAPVALCLFLACFPSKKEAKLPLLLFLISNIILALSGNRFEIISSILLIIIYYLIRNKTDNNVWIKKKSIIMILLCVPIAILVLQFMIYWREGVNTNSIDNPYLNFLFGVGGSSDLISATEKYSDLALSDNILYSFGNLWRSIHGNIIAKILGFHVKYQYQTIDMVLYGHSLSASMTYFLYPKRYIAGYGLGGCYIAELLHDFSIWGIIIGNFIIGMVIGYFNKLRKGRFIYNFCCIFTISLFLRLPRDAFDYVLVEFLGIKNIIVFLLIIVFARQMAIRKSKR